MRYLPILFLLGTTVLSETSACDGIEIVSRSSWSARWPSSNSPLLKLPVEHLFIAHTVTPECHDKSECSARMRGMQNYHMDTQEWPDIGYNYVVGGDGRVYEGAGWIVEGVHTYRWNARSLGIAFVGNFMQKQPNQNMLDAVKNLIICGIKQGYISPRRELHGARDAVCTASPGDELYKIISTWPRFVGGRLPVYSCG